MATGRDIRAVAADAERVYWTERGTTDALGNYLRDGVLRARPLDGGTTTTLAEGLPGPMQRRQSGLGLTSTSAFVNVDRWIGDDFADHVRLMRVPIGGGEAEVLPSGGGVFAAHDSAAYWIADGVLTIRPEDAAPTVLIRSTDARWIAAGDSGVFIGRHRHYLSRLTAEGSETESAPEVGYPFAVHDGELIGVEDTPADEPDYLRRWDAARGVVRFQELPDIRGRADELRVAGDLAMATGYRSSYLYEGGEAYVAVVNLATGASATVEYPFEGETPPVHWALGPRGVVVTDGERVAFIAFR